jgi:hypothetical protein
MRRASTRKMQIYSQAVQFCRIGMLLNDVLLRITTASHDQRRIRQMNWKQGGSTIDPISSTEPSKSIL